MCGGRLVGCSCQDTGLFADDFAKIVRCARCARREPLNDSLVTRAVAFTMLAPLGKGDQVLPCTNVSSSPCRSHFLRITYGNYLRKRGTCRLISANGVRTWLS